ncbi:MAG: 6,7-dimethyl-8-ribityllumazine synthase [Flavobacteriales bacterium]|jgi:6,7-dimethyl-8-ribityllumazine synthase
MATSLTNLSSFDSSSLPKAISLRIGIVVSEWNGEITQNLFQGCKEVLVKAGVQDKNITVIQVPGAFELPFGAQLLAESFAYDAIICLGCVIRGATAHFDYVCSSCATGVMNVSLKFNKPVVFGVLTDDTIEQSKARSGGEHGNKGVESAVTALKMAEIQRTSKDESWFL